MESISNNQSHQPQEDCERGNDISVNQSQMPQDKISLSSKSVQQQ